MLPNDAETIARELLSAHQAGQMVTMLPSSLPGFDLDAAYHVEAALVKFRAAAGFKAVGLKVGYANKAVWRLLN